MRNSFDKLCEDLARWQAARLDEAEAPALDDQVKAIVARGLEIRPDRADGQTFWDDFIKVVNGNPDAAAKLLGVGRETMAQWPHKIRQAVTVIRASNDHTGGKKATTMLSTGF